MRSSGYELCHGPCHLSHNLGAHHRHWRKQATQDKYVLRSFCKSCRYIEAEGSPLVPESISDTSNVIQPHTAKQQQPQQHHHHQTRVGLIQEYQLVRTSLMSQNFKQRHHKQHSVALELDQSPGSKSRCFLAIIQVFDEYQTITTVSTIRFAMNTIRIVRNNLPDCSCPSYGNYAYTSASLLSYAFAYISSLLSCITNIPKSQQTHLSSCSADVIIKQCHYWRDQRLAIWEKPDQSYSWPHTRYTESEKIVFRHDPIMPA